ncbi:MAG: radical SAM protein, partial [Candidatus Aminicenantales bacterium]
RQIQRALECSGPVDAITFSGSGEPTLYANLGLLIRSIKSLTDLPIAVLTNSTLMTRKAVRNALLEADIVVPSLDGASQQVFERINRPHGSLSVDAIIRSLGEFRKAYPGALWLEILFVKGMNDSDIHIEKLQRAASRIQPDRIQLNTVVRPPACASALPLTRAELKRIQATFGKKSEIIAEIDRTHHVPSPANLEKAVLSILARRPSTLEEMAGSLGKGLEELAEYLEDLHREGKLERLIHRGKKVYALTPNLDTGKDFPPREKKGKRE